MTREVKLKMKIEKLLKKYIKQTVGVKSTVDIEAIIMTDKKVIIEGIVDAITPNEKGDDNV